jgi:hypothetical protein
MPQNITRVQKNVMSYWMNNNGGVVVVANGIENYILIVC